MSKSKGTPRFIESLGSTLVQNRGTAILRSPQDLVFDLVGYPEGICKWDPSILSMTPLGPSDEGPQRVGSRYRVRSWAGVGKKINDRVEEVLAFEPGRLRAIRCEVPFIRFEITTTVEPRDRLVLCHYESRVLLFGHMRLLANVVRGFGEKNIQDALKALKSFVAGEVEKPGAPAPGRSQGRAGAAA